MGQFRMSYEGEGFIGPAGSQASTRLTNAVDISINQTTEKAKTVVRGTSDAPPIDAEAVVLRVASYSVQMRNNSSDSNLETMRTAVAAGTPIAWRMKDHAAGKGYDGDVNVELSHSVPLTGENVVEFTLTPNNQLRQPQLYV